MHILIVKQASPRNFTSGRSALVSTDPEQRIAEVASALGAIFDRAGLRVALIGGHAVNFWQRPRYTDDFDFTVAANAEAVEAAVSRLMADGFEITRDQAPDAASGPDFVQLKNPITGDIVELQTAKTPYQELVIERAVKREPTQPLAVATPEDLIVLKLIAHRSVDQRDVIRLGSLPSLDWGYIAYWAEVWGVADRCEELRAALTHDAASNPTS
jgi:hypothetical protein